MYLKFIGKNEKVILTNKTFFSFKVFERLLKFPDKLHVSQADRSKCEKVSTTG